MSGIEAVFFDCDGTLVDSEVICSRAYVAMFQEFGIQVEVLPDICNCLPSNPKYLDKNRHDVLIYHCAGGGVRFWTYTWNSLWQPFYQEYLAMGGKPHTDKEHAWLKWIKKLNLQRWAFFDRSPDPQMHPARFIKYVLAYQAEKTAFCCCMD